MYEAANWSDRLLVWHVTVKNKLCYVGKHVESVSGLGCVGKRGVATSSGILQRGLERPTKH
jgi:hypothetical protein